MKRFFLLVFPLCLAAGPLRATAERPLKATLTEARGEVKVKESGSSPWEAADAGMVIASGARLKTGPDGAADLLFEDGTALHADKNADLSVVAASQTDGQRSFSLRLWAGRLLSQVAKKKGNAARYSVRTPVAVAAVRGTEFVADAAEDNTQLAVFEGEVETQSSEDEGKTLGEPVSVKPDQEVSVDRGRPVGMPRAISWAMSEYREKTAALFTARIDSFRRDTALLQKLQQDAMERRRQRIDGQMRQRHDKDADTMRDFRRRLRRRAAPSDPPR